MEIKYNVTMMMVAVRVAMVFFYLEKKMAMVISSHHQHHITSLHKQQQHRIKNHRDEQHLSVMLMLFFIWMAMGVSLSSQGKRQSLCMKLFHYFVQGLYYIGVFKKFFRELVHLSI